MAPLVLPLSLPLQLSPQQQRGYEQLAMSIVQRNLVHLEDHIDRTRRELPVDKRHWKLFKTREAIDIYRSQDPFHPDIFAPSSRRDPFGADPSSVPRVQLSKLLCVGTLMGSVEDAMLGSATSTQLLMATRSLYIQDEFIQHRVLHDIRRPTAGEPFDYIGLKWALRASPIASIVSPRDLVYVEASGFHTLFRRDGGHERIGYVVYHSVDLAELPPLTNQGVTRAKYSLCIFTRQAAPGHVEVYATLVSDPGGHLPPKLAALSAASALTAVSRAMDCAFDRTLAWLLTKRVEEDASRRGHAAALARHSRSAKGKWWCGQCARELASYRTRTACCLCLTPVCSRCVKTKRLALGDSAVDLALVPVAVCTGCITVARRLDNAAQVAMDESRGPQHGRASSVWLAEVATRHARQDVPLTPQSTASFQTESVGPLTQRSKRDTADTVTIEDDRHETDEVGGSQYGSSQTSTPHSWDSRSQAQSPHDSDRRRMFQMMTSLRLQAEETYSATVSLSLSASTSSRFEVVVGE